ncbi:Mad2l1-binding protein [Plakobranchus ocellatus]|uniref:Mad2l1-binding protein n=1 Tax=Plakobranchus ocellatus TaxID=259542 RepID=A0AAV4CSS0_9GAST|nr:Mad2l1-binding protein [Plakobranchus ocellatus]
MNGLGDNKPSKLMDNMLSLLGQHQLCFLFKQIFLQQLPDHVRTPLSVSAISDYRTLAREADKLFLAGGLDKYPKLAQCGNPEPQLDAVISEDFLGSLTTNFSPTTMTVLISAPRSCPLQWFLPKQTLKTPKLGTVVSFNFHCSYLVPICHDLTLVDGEFELSGLEFLDSPPSNRVSVKSCQEDAAVASDRCREDCDEKDVAAAASVSSDLSCVHHHVADKDRPETVAQKLNRLTLSPAVTDSVELDCIWYQSPIVIKGLKRQDLFPDQS